MSALAERTRYTPEDLLTMPDGDRYELVDGQLVATDMGAEASWVAGELFYRLRSFNEQAHLGFMLPQDTTFQCFAEARTRVRKPDASFIRSGRLPGNRVPKGHIRIPPDLAVEVISPNDLYSEVAIKVEEYLRAGVPLVWLVDPEARVVDVFRSGPNTRLREDDELSGEEVLPGFRIRVGDILPPPEVNVPAEDER